MLDVINTDCEKRFAYAAQLAARFSQSRGPVHGVLDLWLDYWRDLMLVKTGGRDIITNIDRTDELVEMAWGYRLSQITTFIRSLQAAAAQLRQNANPRLALEVLMLDIPRKEGEENLTTRFAAKHG